MKSVGGFEYEFSDRGYPFWCKIKTREDQYIKFSHRDIADLKHIVLTMERVIRGKLTDKEKHEV